MTHRRHGSEGQGDVIPEHWPLWKIIAVGYCEWTNGDWPDNDDIEEARAPAKHIAGYVERHHNRGAVSAKQIAQAMADYENEHRYELTSGLQSTGVEPHEAILEDFEEIAAFVTDRLRGAVSDDALPVLGGGAHAWPAEGGRVAIRTCAICGASLLLDPAHKVDVVELHRLWHEDQGR